MESKRNLDKLNQARRALDGLSQVEILDEWQYDNKLKIWYLHLSIVIEYETHFFPLKSQWYVTVESKYPQGKIKVYPDVMNSITDTLYHQANNSQINENGLWRKGSLCLEVNTISDFQPEPYSIDERLLYHVERAVCWLKLAAKGKLVTEGEPFEMPDFYISNKQKMKLVFSEDMVTFMQWEDVACRYGIVELDVYKSDPLVFYTKTFKALNNSIQNYTKWGTFLSKEYISPPDISLWILLDQIPIVNEWQAPETFGELVVACKRQNIDIMSILQSIVSKIRDGKRHLLLLGFPIPRTFGGENESIFWQALYLPTVSFGKNKAKGFRNNQKGWWMRDKCEVFTKNAKLDWIVSENWNQNEISQRGKMNDLLLRKKILLIGAGCIGASISEIFVRAGVYNITIADLDIFEIGNLSRHILNLKNMGEFKGLSVCNYLNTLNPHANVKVINNFLSNDDSFKTNFDMDKYDIIVDCTGENSVLDIIAHTNFKRPHIIVSASVGLGAKRLYIALMSGNAFDFNSFHDLIYPYIQEEKDLYDDYDLPRNGIGCWHPTFPGRSDDIWLAAATSVKLIENYIISKSNKTLLLIYEQKEKDGIFENYEVVVKREDE